MDSSLFLSLFFSTFVSEDLSCIGGGVLYSLGNTPFFWIYLSLFLGIFLGDLGLFGLGALIKKGSIQIQRFKPFLNESSNWKASQKLKHNFVYTIFLSRFMPGTRLPLYTLSGFLGLSFFTFFFVSFIAVSIWTALLVFLSSIFGAQMKHYFSNFSFTTFLLTTIGLLYILYRVIIILSKKEDRNILLISVQKIFRLEFWPSYIFYLPLVPYAFYLILRYRGIRHITTSNPGILASGIAGESKSEILKLLPSSFVAKWKLLRPSQVNLEKELKEWMVTNQLKFPLILKPDKGERGLGVQKVLNLNEIQSIMGKTKVSWILQEMIPGPFEAGIFYYRFPNDNKGNILSITDKVFPKLIGDGKSKLKNLIEAHPRFRFQKETHFKNNAERLNTIPRKEEVVSLGNIGNHIQGCMFLDGSSLITESLTRKIDQISKKAKGFYFGRYDIRYQSIEDLKQGKNFKIIELNGATSESTNLYDPNFSIIQSYSYLFKQWKILVKIGYINYKMGVPLYPYKNLYSLLIDHFKYRKELII